MDLDRVVRESYALLDTALAELEEVLPATPFDSLASWRLHAANILSPMLKYLLIPAWREHPGLATGGLPDGARFESVGSLPPGVFFLPAAAVERGDIAINRIKALLVPLAADVDSEPDLRHGVAETDRELTAFGDYLVQVRIRYRQG